MFVKFFDWIFVVYKSSLSQSELERARERERMSNGVECVEALSYPFQSILIISHPTLLFDEMPSQRNAAAWSHNQLINNKLRKLKTQTSINNFVWHLFLIQLLFRCWLLFNIRFDVSILSHSSPHRSTTLFFYLLSARSGFSLTKHDGLGQTIPKLAAPKSL